MPMQPECARTTAGIYKKLKQLRSFIQAMIRHNEKGIGSCEPIALVVSWKGSYTAKVSEKIVGQRQHPGPGINHVNLPESVCSVFHTKELSSIFA